MEKNITDYFIKQGLIFGMVNVLLTILIYFLGADFLASHFIMIPGLLLVVAIIYPIVITIRYRNMNEHLLSFNDAFKISFFILAISGLITAAFGILLYHVIDPEYPKMVQQKMIEKLTDFMTSMNVPEDKIQESLQQNNMAEKFSIQGQIKSYLFSIIFYAILSLIVALIAKRNKHPFENEVS
jgi:uncharacterized membrane protein (DUF106 family)